MPLPSPHKGEDRRSWLARALSDGVLAGQIPEEPKRLSYAYVAWKEHARKVSAGGGLIIKAGNNMYAYEYQSDASVQPGSKHEAAKYGASHDYVSTPEGPEKKVLQVSGDNTDPIQDSGPNKPVSPNKAPPAAPFPAKVAPPPGNNTPDSGGDSGKDSKPAPNPDDSTPTDEGGNAVTDDDDNEEYLGRAGKTKVDPKDPFPPLSGTGLDPNPDNESTMPKASVTDFNPDSVPPDDNSTPRLDKLNWFLGNAENRRAILSSVGLEETLETEPGTTIAKWPLSFKRINRDFKPVNRVPDPNAEPKHQNNEDAEKLGQQEKPYQTGTPPI